MSEIAPPSKGIASTVAALIAILGTFEMAYPGKIPGIKAILHAKPVIEQALPLAMTILGTLYAAASSPAPWLRKLMPWKKKRRAQ